MKSLIQKTKQYLRYFHLAIFLSLSTSPVVFAQQAPSLSEVNDALDDQTSEVARFAQIAARIIVIIAFVLLLANLVFKTVEQSKAIVAFLTILFVWGLFEIIF
jgi:uncharacterized Tic20 family protein